MIQTPGPRGLIDFRPIMYSNRKGGIRCCVSKHGAGAGSFDYCFATDAEMALKSATIGSKTDSDTPPVIGPEEVRRLANDHRSLVVEWIRLGNVAPPLQDNRVGRAPSQISIVSPRKAHPMAFPAVGDIYHALECTTRVAKIRIGTELAAKVKNRNQHIARPATPPTLQARRRKTSGWRVPPLQGHAPIEIAERLSKWALDLLHSTLK